MLRKLIILFISSIFLISCKENQISFFNPEGRLFLQFEGDCTYQYQSGSYIVSCDNGEKYQIENVEGLIVNSKSITRSSTEFSVKVIQDNKPSNITITKL